MDWGMKNRMSRIINPDTGRAVMLALDHGYFLGPTHRLEEPRKTITPLLPYADTIMLTRGVLRSSVDPEADTNVVLRVSGGTSIVGPDLTDEGLTTSFEEAIRLNVAGVGISVFIGSEHERQTLLNLADLVDQGEKYGIPVLGITAVGKELEKRDARYLSLCCRICAELGTHIVKTYFCGRLRQWLLLFRRRGLWRVECGGALLCRFPLQARSMQAETRQVAGL